MKRNERLRNLKATPEGACSKHDIKLTKKLIASEIMKRVTELESNIFCEYNYSINDKNNGKIYGPT
jgi:hypothetical protein